MTHNYGKHIDFHNLYLLEDLFLILWHFNLINFGDFLKWTTALIFERICRICLEMILSEQVRSMKLFMYFRNTDKEYFCKHICSRKTNRHLFRATEKTEMKGNVSILRKTYVKGLFKYFQSKHKRIVTDPTYAFPPFLENLKIHLSLNPFFSSF